MDYERASSGIRHISDSVGLQTPASASLGFDYDDIIFYPVFLLKYSLHLHHGLLSQDYLCRYRSPCFCPSQIKWCRWLCWRPSCRHGQSFVGTARPYLRDGFSRRWRCQPPSRRFPLGCYGCNSNGLFRGYCPCPDSGRNEPLPRSAGPLVGSLWRRYHHGALGGLGRFARCRCLLGSCCRNYAHQCRLEEHAVHESQYSYGRRNYLGRDCRICQQRHQFHLLLFWLHVECRHGTRIHGAQLVPQ
jgi:hypothetical protein